MFLGAEQYLTATGEAIRIHIATNAVIGYENFEKSSSTGPKNSGRQSIGRSHSSLLQKRQRPSLLRTWPKFPSPFPL